MPNEIVKHKELQINTSETSSVVIVGEQKAAVNLKLTADEQYYFNTDNTLTIKQYEELKVVCKNTGYKGAALARYHIGNCLMHVYQLVGLTKDKWPSGELAKSIARFIQDTYPFIAPNEIIKSVEFGLQGRFVTTNYDGRSIFEHYGVMDLIYISDILNAYVKFRYDKTVSIESKKEMEKAKKIPVRQQIIEMLKKDDDTVKIMLTDAFNRYIQNPAERVNWIRDAWFEWLVDIGLLKYDKERLNAHYNAIKVKNSKMTTEQIMHEVRIIAIYELFEMIKDEPKPLNLFIDVTYINTVLLQSLWQNGKQKTA